MACCDKIGPFARQPDVRKHGRCLCRDSLLNFLLPPFRVWRTHHHHEMKCYQLQGNTFPLSLFKSYTPSLISFHSNIRWHDKQ
ncbi:hypothetical protein C0J52_00240 [Blattella germanica]|nr:hypothetical protein C0J52_00240 [Blattella germanica]